MELEQKSIPSKATSYFDTLSQLLLGTEVTDKRGNASSLNEGANRAIEMVTSVRDRSGKIMLVGNGGSTAIVSHIQNDLCKSVGIPSLVFNEQPLLMALANDEGFERVFDRPVRLWANPGDLMLAVSSSGASENILRGVQASIDRGCQVITMSGFKPDNGLRRMGQLNFYVASEVYGYVETAHAAMAHFITDRATALKKARSKAEVGA